MIVEDILGALRGREDYRDQIEHIERIPRASADHAEPARPISPQLSARLAEQGVTRLYTHQASALDAIARRQHVVIVTATASGKTLCYNIPVVDSILADSKSRALYLFPTKALAQDQQGKLND